jgi:hypothetical protein
VLSHIENIFLHNRISKVKENKAEKKKRNKKKEKKKKKKR